MEISLPNGQKISVSTPSKESLINTLKILTNNEILDLLLQESDFNKIFEKLMQIITSSSFSIDVIISTFLYIGDEIFKCLRNDPFDVIRISQMEFIILKLEELKNDNISITFIKRYICIISQNALVHLKLGLYYQNMKKHDESIMHYHIVIGIKHIVHASVAINNICHLYLSLENYGLAIKYALLGKEMYPQHSHFLSILGNASVCTRKFEDAEKYFLEEIEILRRLGDSMALSNVYSNLSVCLDRSYDYDKSDEYLNISLDLNPKNYNAFQSKLMTELYKKIPYDNRFHILNEHKKCVAFLKKTKSYEFPREFYNTDKINVGFISGDFEINHPVYIFLKAFLQEHDKNIFNVTCYSQANTNLPGLNIKSIKNLPQPEASDLVYNDKNNILIDLSGFTCKTRLDIFKNKPSPIQITYCGYPATTGLEEMDYRITDQICEFDVNISQEYHTEKLLLMDDCFLCYSMLSIPTIVENIPGDFLILGCFNRVNKITEHTTNLLVYILDKIPNVKIAFNSPSHRQENLRLKFVQRFPEHVRNRILFISSEGKSGHEHLETYNLINIHIDTNPYSGTTTTCDALSMGVPTLTIYDTITCFHVTNVSTSILKNSNLDYYVCSDMENLKDKIVELTLKPKEFWHDFKENVRNNFFNGNVMNKTKYVANFTKLLLKVADRETPESVYLKYINQEWNVDWDLIGTRQNLACVIVEPRSHKNLANVIKNIAHFTKYYPIIWCNSEENKDYLGEEFNKIEKIKISEGNITIQEYNDLLTSADFWDKFKQYERVLIFQTDTCMMKEGIEDFLCYDLIGAPWMDGWSKKIYPVNLICGNGGFTIRNPKLMSMICKNPNPSYNKVPEDYFFSAHIYDLAKIKPSIRLPLSIQEASLFCSETIANENSLAMHAAYKFHSVEIMKILLKI